MKKAPKKNPSMREMKAAIKLAGLPKPGADVLVPMGHRTGEAPAPIYPVYCPHCGRGLDAMGDICRDDDCPGPQS